MKYPASKMMGGSIQKKKMLDDKGESILVSVR